jgi:ATP adenylyltransferase
MTDDSTPQPKAASPPRNPPFLPTPSERLLFAVFPLLLVFGTIFSIVSPETRSALYDPMTQSHSQDPNVAPSYFARKSNLFNVIFVKRGWGWTTFAFYFFLLTHPSGGANGLDLTPRRLRAVVRWVAVTGWWFLITQWCFGPPVIDRGFRWTGGKCYLVEQHVMEGGGGVGDVFTAVACRAAGGKWNGGHDISGHVFLLVLGTSFLAQEMGWSVGRWASRAVEERCVIMPDGAIKSANVEAETPAGQGEGSYSFGIGAKTALGVMGLNLWMLLMTAIYFHTWFEKVCCTYCASMRWIQANLQCTAYWALDCLDGSVPGVLCSSVCARREGSSWIAWRLIGRRRDCEGVDVD